MYHFKVAFKSDDKRKPSSWHRVSLPADASLWELDQAMRRSLGHELDDHLSRFTIFGYDFEIEPFRQSTASQSQIMNIPLKKGQKIDWLYDFGACWEHIVVFVGKEDQYEVAG